MASGVFGTIEAQYEALSPRDRRAIGFLGVFMSTIFVFGLLFTLRGWMNGRAEAIVKAKETLSMLQLLQQDFAAADSVIAAAEERVKQYEGQAVSSFLEKMATKTSVSDEMSVNKQGTELNGAVRETSYRVQLRRVSLEKVVAFVYEVEVSGYPLQISSMETRTQTYKGEKVYNLTLDAVHYEITEGEG